MSGSKTHMRSNYKDFKTNGHYFFREEEHGDETCTIEFQKGRLHEIHRRKDSMFLWDDHFWALDIGALFAEFIPDFDMFTEGSEVNGEQWRSIVGASPKYSSITQEIVAEMDEWMTQAIQEYGCVTIIGV